MRTSARDDLSGRKFAAPQDSAPTGDSAARPSSRIRIGLLVATCAAIALGFYFRFARLEAPFFWLDETHSAAAAAGHTMQEIDGLFDGTTRPLVEVRRFVRVMPAGSPLPTIDAIRSMPENTPVYFVTLRFWAGLFGDSAAALRSYSAALGIVGGLLLLLLCRELNLSRTAAACTLCWWCLSPLLVLYAQEARTYSLFAVWSLAANLMLLRAMRIESWTSWLCYVVAATAGLYTHMFVGLLLIAHAIFVGITGLARPNIDDRRRLFARFAAAGAAIVVAFVPWIVVILRYENNAYLANHLKIGTEWRYLLQSSVEGLGTLFVDFGLHGNTPARAANIAISIAAVAGIAWSIRFVRNHAPRRTSLFLVTTGIVPPLVLVGSDIALGAMRSEIIRFWLPGLISLGMMFGYALGTKCEAGSRRAAIVGLVMIAAAVGSYLRSASAPTWWHKGGIVSRLDRCLIHYDEMNERLAEIAATPNALLVIEKNRFASLDLMAISLVADPRVEWLGVADPERFEPPADRVVYLYHAPTVADRLEERGRRVEELKPTAAFRLVHPESAK